MDSTSHLIIDFLKEEPIGETDHFIWFITDIGIVALFKREKNYEIYSFDALIKQANERKKTKRNQNKTRNNNANLAFW